MKQSELEGLIRGITPPLKQHVADTLAPLIERIARLEGRLDEQQSRFDSLEKRGTGK